MKNPAKVLSVCVMLLAGVVQAQELTPIPDMQVPAVPHGDSGVVMSEPMTIVDAAAYTGTVFTRVRYKDLDEMSPCAVPKLVMVKDPCACEDGCAPKCVWIEICVPACGCEEVTCRRHGDRIRYDYGEYAVDVRIKRGYIEVDYQD